MRIAYGAMDTIITEHRDPILRGREKSRGTEPDLIVDLTVAESRTRRKCTFSDPSDPGIKAQKSTGAELTDIVNTYRIDPPLPGVRPLEEPFSGWIMPVAVKATSRHSYGIRVPLDPIMMMRRLDLRTALKLKGAYHVTSPTYLESILKNGLMPGGGQGKRIMNFFIVFPPWDERNRVTRTRSPLFEAL